MNKGKMSNERDFPSAIIDAFIIDQLSNNVPSCEELMEVRLPASPYELDIDAPRTGITKEIPTVIVIEL